MSALGAFIDIIAAEAITQETFVANAFGASVAVDTISIDATGVFLCAGRGAWICTSAAAVSTAAGLSAAASVPAGASVASIGSAATTTG